MMQLCASAAKLRSGGPHLDCGTTAMESVRATPPRIVIGASLRPAPKRLDESLSGACLDAHAGARMSTPSGGTPVVA